MNTWPILWALVALLLVGGSLYAQDAPDAGRSVDATASSPMPASAAPTVEGPLAPGLYASRQSFSTVVKTPPLGRRQTGITVSYGLHDVAREAGLLVATTRFCSVEPVPFGGVKSTMSDAFVAAMPTPRAAVSVEGPEDGPWSVEFEEWTIVIGAELENPVADPLPEDDDDPRVTDPDGDDKPGVTVELTGTVRGRTYVVQRLTRGMRGTLRPDGRMQGTLSGRAEQQQLGASNPILGRFKPTFLDETEAAHNRFDWRPVPAGTTCADLADLRDTLFE